MEGYHHHQQQQQTAEQTAEQTALEATTDQDLRVPYYCEENVWRLGVRKRTHQPTDRFWAVFISNSIKNVPMFQQKAAVNGEVSCCWDYHVFLLCHRAGEGQAVVYDVDSLLPYPCPLDEYLAQSFPYNWPYPFGPMFRVIPMELFLQHFGSERSHMRDKNGNYQAPPPPYAPIGAPHHNLQEYLRFDDSAVRQNGNTNNNNNAVYGRFLDKAGLAAADISTFP